MKKKELKKEYYEEYQLLSNVKNALDGVENGDPFKDFIDEDEVIDALRLLIKITMEKK